MKNRILFLAFAFVALCFSTGFAQSGNANSLENRALAVSQDCWQPHSGAFAHPYAELVGQGRCIDGGTVNTFAIRISYSAPTNILPYVLLPGPLTVGYVTFGCDNRVSSVTCE